MNNLAYGTSPLHFDVYSYGGKECISCFQMEAGKFFGRFSRTFDLHCRNFGR
ncbi:hypothetical protein [Heyndrickxia ginsengihumi]|uniref:hypothetical protein n=1 Tax=Heyndrickxia ginsengihumi TaxID=363870 RepID=UPI003D24EA3E